MELCHAGTIAEQPDRVAAPERQPDPFAINHIGEPEPDAQRIRISVAILEPHAQPVAEHHRTWRLSGRWQERARRG